MPLYRITGETADHRRVERVVEASGKAEAAQIAEGQGIFVFDVRARLLVNPVQRVRRQDIIVFTRLLSVVVGSGLALNDGLRVVYGQLPPGAFRRVVEQILTDVESGVQLSRALANHQQIFDPLYVGLVMAGEAAGRLDITLRELHKFLERRESLRKKLRAALTYPAVVFSFTLGIVAFFMFWLIPRWQKNLHKSLDELPAFSRVVFESAHFARENSWLILLLLFLAGAALALFARTPAGRLMLARFRMSLPVFGNITRNGVLVRLTRSLQTLVQNRVLLTESLKVARHGLDNPLYSESLGRVVERVEGGEYFSAALEAENGENLYPLLLLQMARMGEESGKLGEMLEHAADFFDSELELSFQKIQSLIQPLIIIFLGIFVGAMVLALFLPMFGGLGKL